MISGNSEHGSRKTSVHRWVLGFPVSDLSLDSPLWTKLTCCDRILSACKKRQIMRPGVCDKGTHEPMANEGSLATKWLVTLMYPQKSLYEEYRRSVDRRWTPITYGRLGEIIPDRDAPKIAAADSISSVSYFHALSNLLALIPHGNHLSSSSLAFLRLSF